jgi:hypothetical protein
VFSYLVAMIVPAGQPDVTACRSVAAAVISPAQGLAPGEAEPQAPVAASQATCDGEQAQPKPLGSQRRVVPSRVGLVPLMGLAQRAGLGELVARHVRPGGACGATRR